MAIVHVVGNPKAARGRSGVVAADVADELRRLGHEPIVVEVATVDQTRSALVDLAVDAERLMLVGGDGLVHLAVQSLATSGTPFGVIAAGTGNDFARALGLPLDDVGAAVRAGLEDPVAIDAIRTADRWVASVATVGFSVDVNRRADKMRWPGGKSRYTIATLTELASLRPVPLTMQVDERTIEVEATMVAVANTGYFGGGMHIAPDADPCDGLLDVVIVGAAGRVELLRFFPEVFDGRHVSHRSVEVVRGSTVRLDGEAEHWGDGEPVGHLPETFEAARRALLVAGPTSGRVEHHG